MLAIQNVLIDDLVKPAIEWINGKAVQKLMPTDWHAILQLAFGRYLTDWMDGENSRGNVGSEWRFLIPPNSYQTESLVPDIAYLSTYFDLPKSERKYQKVPPDIVIEILSPDDEESEIKAKREFYLWWGVRVVFIGDPEKRTVTAYETDDYSRTFSQAETLTSLAFPTLAIPLRSVFGRLDEPL
jgi:Uma2 family endonuclease